MNIMITRKKMFIIWIAKGDNSVESTLNNGLLELGKGDEMEWVVFVRWLGVWWLEIDNWNMNSDLNFAQAMFYLQQMSWFPDCFDIKSNIYQDAGNT